MSCCCKPQECKCISITSIAEETPITPLDSNTVDLTVSGAYDHTIKADVRVSAASGNTLSVLSDGLYVSGTNVDCNQVRSCLSVEDTDTIDSSYNQITGQFSANVKVSSNPNNNLSIASDGLFASGVDNLVTVNPGNPNCQLVGPNSMIKNASIVGDTLNIWGAPEVAQQITSISAFNIISYSPPVGSLGLALETTNLIVSFNPCRSTVGYIFIRLAIELNKPSAVGWYCELDVSTNSGVTWTTISTYNLNSGVAYNGTFDVSASPFPVAVPIGGPNQTVRVRARMRQNGGAFGDIVIVSRNIVLSSFGVSLG
jgi:hypothetical protein